MNNISSTQQPLELPIVETQQKEIWNSSIFPLLSLVLLVLIVHGNALTFGFAREDITLFKSLGEWNFWGKYFGYWRPIWTLCLSLQYTLFGLNPHAMHAVSLILYAINSWLAFFVMSALGIKRSVAIATVSLWVLMAGNAYSSIWISECNDLLAMFFLLLATLVWISQCQNERPSLGPVCLACLFWLFSIMSKEVGMLWPIGAVAIAAYRFKGLKKKECRSWNSYLILSLPLVCLISYIGLKFLAQGPSAGLNLFEYAYQEKATYSYPLLLKFIKMTMHYLEGIFYSYLPLELFLSWAGLIAGTLVGFSLILCLAIRNKGHFPSNVLPLLGGLFWILFFSIHTSFNPSARTQYIATLGTAFLICSLFLSAKTRKCLVPTLVILAVYIGMHVCLGKQVAEYFSPSNPTIISCHAKFLDRPDISPEKKAYLRNELWYVDIDKMANHKDYMLIDKGPWKKFKKVIFQKVCIKEFSDNSEN